MREVFILENMAACVQFINEKLDYGIGEEHILGVGGFACDTADDQPTGVQVRAVPQFLTADVMDALVQGTLSLFEQEPVFVHAQAPVPYAGFSRWLMCGQSPSLFLLPSAGIAKSIPYLEIESADDFVAHHYSQVCDKVTQLQPQVAVFLLDTTMLCRYTQAFFAWKKKAWDQTAWQATVQPEPLTENDILLSFFNFLAGAPFPCQTVVVPSQPQLFALCLRLAHDLKQGTHLQARDIIFRL